MKVFATHGLEQRRLSLTQRDTRRGLARVMGFNMIVKLA